MSGARLTDGGLIDRTRPINFRFDGRAYAGFAGDTLASALLAQGVSLMGRSFKYHRPRGVLAAGVEEPNALVGVGSGGRFEPNTRSTDVVLYEGLEAVSQNRWPSLSFDLGAVNQWLAPAIPAGFYYKTFFGGPRLWRIYEHFIRRAAGLGAPPTHPDADRYAHRAAFCDVLVVGAGPAGLAAAQAAARAGARVILVEQDRALGGSLLRDAARIDGRDGLAWADVVRSEVEAGGRVLTRATALGVWDHGLVTVVERLCEPGQPPPADRAAQRLWRVRARRIVLATGAIERPLLFGGNDMPGVMLSGAVRTYLARFGVLAGRRVAIATASDDAYLTAWAVTQAGGEVAAVLDSRPATGGAAAARVAATVPVHFDAKPVRAEGRRLGVRRLVAAVGGRELRLDCDLVAVCGGFTPVVHLHRHVGGALDWREAIGAPVASGEAGGVRSAGAAAGTDGLAEHLADGWRAGVEAAAALELNRPAGDPPMPDEGLEASGVGADYAPAAGASLKTAFVDLQNDITAADIDLAWREGYRSVEHLKRYTTLGMATDQGKTSNLIGLARLAAAEGRPMAEVGLTTFRPPYTPVTLGVLAGEAVGRHVAPSRRLPLHDLHVARGAVWQPSGYWSRPRAFPRGGETVAEAALREATTVRTTLGLTDVSTLAKFEIAGPDAAALLERVCATRIANLAVGRGRYTFMLREDGLVADDGTVWRLDDERYLLTSSTGGADRMAAQISYVRKVLAGDLQAAVAEVQEHWAAAALAGPRARRALGALMETPPPAHMAVTCGRLAGVAVRVLAASYSGERTFEVYARAFEMGQVWAALSAATEAGGGAVYGLDALELLRIEKGHPEVGAEIDGRRTPGDLGLGRMLNPQGGYLGAQGLMRPALHVEGRQVLVGLEAGDPIPEGAMLIPGEGAPPEGHVTSSGLRLDGEGAVALALLQDGRDRTGEALLAASPTRGRTVGVRVVSPHHYDPAGTRYRD